MARNSVDSQVRLLTSDEQIIKLEGKLVSQTATAITFLYKPKGQRRRLQRPFPIAKVAAYSDNVLYVKQSVSLMKITGQLETNKINDFLVVDGINFNPTYAEAIADFGVEDSGEGKATVKKKKKAAK